MTGALPCHILLPPPVSSQSDTEMTDMKKLLKINQTKSNNT